ncbi:hypothetical protein GOD21_15075 [Sinorhizobium medicae]|nr:hypothetical protein [Sinorhizobium medicae]
MKRRAFNVSIALQFLVPVATWAESLLPVELIFKGHTGSAHATVKVGQQLRIILPSRTSLGYKWHVTKRGLEESAVISNSSPTEGNSDLLGRIEMETFFFTFQKPGRVALEFRSLRFTETHGVVKVSVEVEAF